MAKQRPDGWWYPWIFVGGFMVVLSVNAAMLYFSTSTFNGLETRHAYEEGNSYNALIAAEEKQKTLGWTVQLGADAAELPNQSATGPRLVRLTLTVKDRESAPIEGMEVKFQIRRPTQEGYDQSVTLDPVSPGFYARTVELAMPGQWEVRVMARRGTESYRLRDRIDVR